MSWRSCNKFRLAAISSFMGMLPVTCTRKAAEYVILPHWLTGRPVNAGQGNADGLYSWAAWDSHAAGEAQITLWTRLHINAVFSESISMYTEFECLESWGESFRSQYLTGRDFRALPD